MSRTRVRRMCASLLVGCVLALLAAGSLAGAAAAAAESESKPWWRLETLPAPTILKPGQPEQVIEIVATNLGDARDVEADGSPAQITISDRLPAGFTPTAIVGERGKFPAPQPVPHCTLTPLACEWTTPVPPFSTLSVAITGEVAAGVTSVTSEAEVKGGVAQAVSSRRDITVGESEAGFGVQNYELLAENEDGSPEPQSGSHPFQLTTALAFDQTPLKTIATSAGTKIIHSSPALAKDVSVKLPPGLVANATAVAQCPGASFTDIGGGNVNSCPANTAIGVATVLLSEPKALGYVTETVPVFNLVPALGEPARFGFETTKVPVILDTALEAGGGYHSLVSVKNASQAVILLSSQVTIWGAPADKRHDASRGWACLIEGIYQADVPEECHPADVASPPALLTLPTECGRLSSTVSVDSWSEPGSVLPSGLPVPADSRWKDFPPEGVAPTGQLLGNCGALPFTPTTEVAPDSHAASTPTGLSVNLKVPQETTLSDATLAEADVRDTVVALPPGIQASPGAANGLETCAVAQSGFEALDSDQGEVLERELGEQRFTSEPVTCPDGSKIGSVEIFTPLLETHLTGSVYLASQDTNPFGTPLVLYLIAEDPVTGVRVKLAGDVSIDQVTGQLVSTFKKAPPLPFSELKLHLFDGARASQSTPSLCGTYQTPMSLTPSSGDAAVNTSSSFSISQGAGGGPCESATQSFGPSFQAGPTGSQAAGFTDFTLTINHSDADQPLSGLTMALPQGAAAMLSKLTPCPEPPAGQPWICGAESYIGTATSSSGFGSDPVTLQGSVYLTSGYDGAPFGLLVSTNAEHVGPFDLGVINVRSRINVDRNTAAVSITTDPGPRGEVFPTRIKGVPVDLKNINVTVNRPEFEFNPTSCSPLSTSGLLNGLQGAGASFSVPYPVTGCTALAFGPKLTAYTQGNASKANGASLTVKVEAIHGQANIAKTKLVLPLKLPSRLTTIQKACPDTTFEKGAVAGAACDEGSEIGNATVHTPVLKNPLKGKGYLVSHGNAAFPDVEFVLQGEVELILDGKTDIKKGITTSTFESLPDAPVTTFEAVLPEGPHSALTSNVAESKKFNLCGAKLAIPTTITGQNGAVIQQETKVPVQGCAAVKGFKVTRAQQLAKALKACRKQFKHKKSKRSTCERRARKKYGAKKSSKKKASKHKSSAKHK